MSEATGGGPVSFAIKVFKPGVYSLKSEFQYRPKGADTYTSLGEKTFTVKATAEEFTRTAENKGIIQPPTCTKAGKSMPEEYNKCYKWGVEYFSDEDCNDDSTIVLLPINPLGHAWDDGTVTTPATCSAEGVKTYVCKNDADHTKTENVPKNSDAHEWGEWTEVTPANCVEKGTRKRVCSLNSEHSQTEDTAIAPNNHKSDLIYVEEKAPTISSYGEKAHWECSDCGKKCLDKDGKNEATDADLVIDKLAYSYKASAYKWVKGSNSGCSLTADNNYSGIEAFEKFDSLYIDRETVAKTNYSLEKGSVIITLKPSYLNTLKNGKHTVKAVFSDGGEAETVLSIENKSTESPSTGDDTTFVPVWVVLILSMMSAAFFFVKGHYTKRKAFINIPSSDNEFQDM